MAEPNRHLYARGMLLGALLLGVVANTADFARVDRELGTIYAAINRYESAEVTELVAAHGPTVRERFQLYTDMRRWAKGTDVQLTPNLGVSSEQLVGLAGAGEISSWDGDHQLSEEELTRVAAHTVASGSDRWAGEYALAVAPEEVETIVLLRQDERLLLIDVRLLPGLRR